MRTLIFVFLLALAPVAAADVPYPLPMSVGTFPQQTHRPYTTAQGLPSNDVQKLVLDAEGRVVAITSSGTATFENEFWQTTTESVKALPSIDAKHVATLLEIVGDTLTINDVAFHADEITVATNAGLYTHTNNQWRLLLPRQGDVGWAPRDVRAVVYDAAGRLCFAAPQGVGVRESDDDWHLYTGSDGLPFNDFTCTAASADALWFGTTNGAIRLKDGAWSFRQGRRWLLDNHVRDIVVDAAGRAWIATSGGVSCLVETPTTLAEKAAYFNADIEKYHRRTPYGYVAPAEMATPGDRSTAKPVFTDNDGHFTGNYLGAVSLGYAATGDPQLKQLATNAFNALVFLSEVTEGGTHPAPKGFIARTIRSTEEPDPNPAFDINYDLRRNKADTLWKIIQPRWPIDETGKWYWKNDSSSDELDGHFFGYAIYFDRVCETEPERDAVRVVVRRIVDHIVSHGYNLVDHDGKPTRWGRFSPDDMNRNEAWYDERGLNSMSILTYLAIAHHITGDPKYRDIYLDLALTHGYGMNGMTQPNSVPGPGTVAHQPDDNMAFMNYYHLIRYETDPKLLSMYYRAISVHWQYEKRERNPLENFIYAACCLGKTRTDQWGTTDLTPPAECFELAIDALKRYPLDLINWPMSNAHRTDLQPIPGESDAPTGKGGGIDGRVYPIDERHETYWDLDPWLLTYNGDATRLRDGAPFLLAYYMGLAHGFIAD